MIYHLTPLFSSLNNSKIMRAIRIACGFACLLYSWYVEVSCETRKGGDDEGHWIWSVSFGALSKQTNPLVLFGSHQASMQGFLLSHVFAELAIPNTRWEMLVGESTMEDEDEDDEDHDVYLKFAKRAEDRQQGWLDRIMQNKYKTTPEIASDLHKLTTNLLHKNVSLCCITPDLEAMTNDIVKKKIA